MEAIPPAFLEGVGVVAVVLIVGWMLATGRLVTRRELEQAVHDRDEWRTESRIKDQQIVELSDQNAQMLNAFGPTLTDFLEGLRRAGANSGGGNP